LGITTTTPRAALCWWKTIVSQERVAPLVKREMVWRNGHIASAQMDGERPGWALDDGMDKPPIGVIFSPICDSRPLIVK
jgi:hypothetical protein